MRRRPHRHPLVVALGAAGLGALALLASPTPGPRAAGGASPAAAAAATTWGSAAPELAGALGIPAEALDPAMLSSEALRQALADYERDSIYPPSSHRFSEEHAAQMEREWNQPIVSDVGLDDRPGQETMIRFAADRAHAQFGEALTTRIEVWPVADPSLRLPVEIHSAVVLATGGRRPGRTGILLTYRDDGLDGDEVANDHIYSNRFLPSQYEELASAMRVHISADVEVAGVQRLVTCDFTYTPRPLLDLTAVETAAVDGSLAIDLSLEVHEPGLYLLYASVYAADGETPIGWVTQHWTELGPGKQEVALSLFGKVLHDAGTPGPYVIKDIRAMHREADGEAEMWWSDPREFTTGAFSLAQFSPDAWDGPERRELIATMEQSIREQEQAERAARR